MTVRVQLSVEDYPLSNARRILRRTSIAVKYFSSAASKGFQSIEDPRLEVHNATA